MKRKYFPKSLTRFDPATNIKSEQEMDWLYPDHHEKKNGLIASRPSRKENGLVASRPSRKEKWTGCIQTIEKRKWTGYIQTIKKRNMDWLHPDY